MVHLFLFYYYYNYFQRCSNGDWQRGSMAHNLPHLVLKSGWVRLPGIFFSDLLPEARARHGNDTWAFLIWGVPNPGWFPPKESKGKSLRLARVPGHGSRPDSPLSHGELRDQPAGAAEGHPG